MTNLAVFTAIMVVLILIGVISRIRSQKKDTKRLVQESQAILEKEQLYKEQLAAFEKQQLIEKEEREAYKSKQAEEKQKKAEALQNDPVRHRFLAIQQRSVDGFRYADSTIQLDDGNLYKFVFTGDLLPTLSINAKGESITYTYANGSRGYRLMLPTDFQIKSFSVGNIIPCIVLVASIDGVKRRWLVPANKEEIDRQAIIDRKNQMEKDTQATLERERLKSTELKEKQEKERIVKQKQMDEQNSQEIEKRNEIQDTKSAQPAKDYQSTFEEGTGVVTYSDGTKYKGDFVNGAKEGFGLLTSPDGQVYEGNFKNDLFNGSGILKKANGDILEGTFKEGKFVNDKVGEDVIRHLNSLKDSRPFYLFIDTETTGLMDDSWFENYQEDIYVDPKTKLRNLLNTPRLVKLSYLVYDRNAKQIAKNDFIIRPVQFIPLTSSKIHGITTEKAKREGVLLRSVLVHFRELYDYTKNIIGHNVYFDEEVITTEFLREGIQDTFTNKDKIDTMLISKDYCAITGKYGYKFPKLSELHYKLFQKNFEGAHDSAIDAAMTAKCYWELKRLGIFKM